MTQASKWLEKKGPLCEQIEIATLLAVIKSFRNKEISKNKALKLNIGTLAISRLLAKCSVAKKQLANKQLTKEAAGKEAASRT